MILKVRVARTDAGFGHYICQSGVWTSASGVKLGEKVIGGYVSYHDSSNSGAAYCPEGAVLIGLINDKSLDSYHMACQVLK
ncbi:hypothetical protein B8W76_01675 [Pseudomonas aeruginosa]|nr:hypothetical protein B8W76_01675 [Pseudomonas aeruginosa]